MAAERTPQSVAREMHDRLHPSIFHARYYHLRQLKKAIHVIIQKYFQNQAEPYEVLIDYGCGSMPYRSLFMPYVKHYLGADIALNKAAEVILDEKGGLPVDAASADVVLSTQVLEHVHDPKFYMQEAYRVLKRDGLLVLSTHGIWMYHPDPVDYWRWTSAGLQKLIQEAGSDSLAAEGSPHGRAGIANQGFEILDVLGIQGLASVGLQLVQDAFLYKLPLFIKWFFVPVMQMRIALADQFHTANHRKKDACVFMIVAKKR